MAANFEVASLPLSELDLWDRLLSSSRQATVFCTSQFSTALFKATGQHYEFLVCFKGDRPIAGLPVFETRRMGLRIAGQPPLVPHLGLVLPAELEKTHPRTSERYVERAVESFSQWLARKYDYINLSHHPNLLDTRPFTWQGYKDRTCYTYRIDLRSFNMDTLHSSARKQVAKATREGLVIEESSDIELLGRLVGMSYGRRGRRVPFDDTYLEVLFKEMSLLGKASLWLVRDPQGKVLSGRILLDSGKVVYDWVAGADPFYYGSGATPLLLHHLIESSREHHEIFDLMGANTPSIAVFKSNFGGTITPYRVTAKSVSFRGTCALMFFGLLGRRRGM